MSPGLKPGLGGALSLRTTAAEPALQGGNTRSDTWLI
jgi:hypothetical protein